MTVLKVILTVIFLIICVAMVVIVLMQEGKSAGLSGAISGAAETYFGKNKARTLEGKFERWTKILAIVYIVFAFVLYLMIASIK